MANKNLADVSVLSSISNSTNAIVEEGGILKKTSLSEAIKGTTVSSIETKTHDLFFGKPIYTKTITFTTSVTASSSTVNNATPHSIANIDKVWIDISNSYLNNGTYFWPLTVSYYMTGFDNCCPYVDKTNIYFGSQGTWGTGWTKCITLRYTKTTD